MFYTSGDDRIFPKGMPVGRATVVRPGKTSKEIYVVPSGFQNGLEEILVVVQGEHQAIPNPTETAASDDIYLMSAPAAPKTTSPAQSPLSTDADRLREKYKEVGDAQGHDFGEGGPGARPPNFNLTVQPPKPAAPAPKASATGQPGQSEAATTPPAKPRPVTPGPEGQPVTNQPRPGGTSATSPAIGVTSQGAPPQVKPVVPRPAPTLGPDGQPISSAAKPRPAGTPPASPATGTTVPGAPAQVKPAPHPTTTTGPDGQPIPAAPKRSTSENGSTINVITPAPRPPNDTIRPRTTDPGPTPAGPPRTVGPKAQPDTSEPKKAPTPAKPKADQSNTPANP